MSNRSQFSTNSFGQGAVSYRHRGCIKRTGNAPLTLGMANIARYRCPVSVTGKKDCHFGDKCKFAREMHGIDLNVVRTTKVGKK